MEYFSGQGALFAGLRSPSGLVTGYRALGNCSNFAVGLGAGGVRFAEKGALRRTGSLPTVEIDFESLDRDNLAALLYGEQLLRQGGIQTDAIVVQPGMMVPLSRINLVGFMTLKSTSGAITYDATQYRVDLAAGAVFFPANTTIPAGATVNAQYAAGSSYAIGAYTKNAPFLSLRFNGVNTLDASPVVAEVFKVRLDPVDALPLINDNLSSLKVVGRVYRDDGINGNRPEGHFMRILKT